MLLRYSFNEDKAAAMIEQAVDKSLAEGWRTPDLYKDGFKKADTHTMTQVVLSNI
jgi:3-isopropylmalate dehydrogenase